MMKKIYTLLITLLCIVPFGSFSRNPQDTTVEISEVKIIADRIFEKETAGMKEHKVDTLILSQKINHSLSDLLSENTSVFVKSYGRGALATASFRGTAASHTIVNWNGLNINSPMLGMVDFSLIPVFLIDDINIKFGAASIYDNSGGLGGSINIINKADWNIKSEIKNTLSYGSYKTINELLKITLGNKKIQSKTRIYYKYSKNDFEFLNRGIGNIDPLTGEITNPLDTNDNAAFRLFGILQELYFRPNFNNTFSIKWWSQNSARTIPRATSYEGPDNSNLNNQKDYDHKLTADWNFYKNKSKLHISSAYNERNLEYVQQNNIVGYGLQTSIYSISKQKTFRSELSYNYDITETFLLKSSVNLNLDLVQSEDTVKKTGYNENRKEILSFFSLHKNFADRLNLILMFRQDWFDFKAAPLIPFFGFDLKIIRDIDFLIKGNIGRNFHQASLNDLYWQPGGNPDLLPEDGISYELGLEFQTNFSNHIFKSEITVYESDINNWIIWVPSYLVYWEPRNIKKVRSKGIECTANLSGNFGRVTYNFRSNYAYSSSINYGKPEIWGDESYGKQLVYVPLHSGNIMMNISYKKFYFTWQHNSYGERFTTSSNNITKRDWLYPYFMNDLIVGKEFKIKKIGIIAEFKIYNLFNEVYHSVLYRPMPKRNYMLSLMIKI